MISMNDSKILFDTFLNIQDDKNEEINNICLISNEPLKNNYIKLECGHIFNYNELYYEVLEQKTKKILDNGKLKLNEIKCPYCRSITNNLLPYFKYYDKKQIRGVNHPQDLCIKMLKCEYIGKDSKKCEKNACITKFGIFCNNHLKYNYYEEEILENSEKEKYTFYKKYTIKELRELLKKYKLKVSGKKEDMINRLIINNKTLDDAAELIQHVG